MEEMNIERSKFDGAKERLKQFSKEMEGVPKFDKVPEKNGIVLKVSHKVTGEELNTILETIQQHFINVNTLNNTVIKEFREVYNAFDELDKEYITSIVTNVKAIEKTSNDVRRQQENIRKIVDVLEKFKNTLNGYEHLEDIDNIWVDLYSGDIDIKKIKEAIKECEKCLDVLENDQKKLSEIVQSLECRFSDLPEKYATIENVEEVRRNISEAETKIKENNETIETVKSDVEKNKEDVSGQIKQVCKCINNLSEIVQSLECRFSDLPERYATIDNVEEVRRNISETELKTNANIETLTKKVKYAYWLVGGSVGLAIIELILLLMKVI